jgi:prepilin-type N-terminal cleavage/methylation domain-containing protein
MHAPRRTFRFAFTLTEVLIALALVALLLVGISRVFALTSDTIKAGQAFNKALRQQKAVYDTLSRDFLGYSSSGNPAQPDDNSGIVAIGQQPGIIIYNQRVSTFVNARAMDISSTTNDSDDQAGRSMAIRTGNGRSVSLPDYGPFNFRVDILSFFTRGSFERQTGATAANDNTWSSPLRSNEAWVWYGHMRVFNQDPGNLDSAAGYSMPGTGTVNPRVTGTVNLSQRYAEQFILGRMQVVLREPITYGGPVPTVVGDNGVPQSFLNRAMNVVTSTGATPESNVSGWIRPEDTVFFRNTAGSLVGRASIWAPLTFGSTPQIFSGFTTANPNGHTSLNTGAPANQTFSAQQARVDVAGVDIATWRARIVAVLREVNLLREPTVVGGVLMESWYSAMFSGAAVGGGLPAAPNGQRPWVNPYPQKPFDSKRMAQRNNVLAEGCSQFVVEFAGDFIGQASDGAVTSNGPDGALDFVQIGGQNFTRWYGLPRDVGGPTLAQLYTPDGRVLGKSLATSSPAPAAEDSLDVVPVRDVMLPAAGGGLFENAGNSTGSVPLGSGVLVRGYSFEKQAPPLPPGGSGVPSGQGNYMAVMSDGQSGGGARDNAFAYLCAFGPEEFEGGLFGVVPPSQSASPARPPVTFRSNIPAYGSGAPAVYPQLIRVRTEMRDPAGALPDPVIQEYIFPIRR